MRSIRETTEFGYCVKGTGGWMQEGGIMNAVTSTLYAPTFLPSYIFKSWLSVFTELKTSKNKNSDCFCFVLFFRHSREESCFGITCFICQKNITYYLQISREEMTIVCGF